MNPKEISILGVKVQDVTKQDVIEQIDQFINERTAHLIVTLGTEMVMAAKNDGEIKDLINSAELVCADGVGILWAAKKMGAPVREKAAGVEILEEAVKLSGEKGWSIFLLGGKPSVAEEAADNLRKKYPKCNISGTYHGYFKNDDEPLDEIRKAKPDIIFTALGFPKQEKWYRKYGADLNIPVGIGVGGSFDVLSGKIDRAPVWMRKAGLEWLFRLLKEPSRWKRMTALPKFVLAVMFSKK